MKTQEQHKNQLGYHIPEGYFETSKNKMLGFLKEQSASKKSIFSVTKTAWVSLGVLCFIIIGILSQNNWNESTKSFEELTIESLNISEDDFNDWFDENFILNDV